jgi:hypothetical protein
MVLEVLPLRAIIYQFLFLLIAIAIEGMIFHNLLAMDYKPSMQYSATVNLLSTVLGWVIFFIAQPLLPTDLRLQLISYIFYERFFPNAWFISIAPLLVLTALGVYIGTFLVELQGLNWLDRLLGKTASEENAPKPQTSGFRGRKGQKPSIQLNNRMYATLLANACSYSVLLLVLFTRLLDQGRFSIL